MDYFRGGDSHHARQFRDETFCCFEAVVIGPALARGLTHGRGVDVAIFGTLVDNPALDRVRDQIKVLLQGRISSELGP